MKLIISIWAWTLVIGSFVLHAFCAPFLAFFKKGKEKEAYYYWSSVPFISCSLKMAGVNIKVEGLEHLPKEGPVVLVSNHQSIMDIWIYMAALPIKIAFFAKQELLKVPILGRDILNQGHFFVDRNNPRNAIKQLEKVKQKVKTGRTILIFPEGTRSIDGEIAAFKRGAFQIALETNAVIVPVCIQGSGAVLPKSSLWITPKNVNICIGEPLRPNVSQNVAKQAKELAKSVETQIKQLKNR